MRLSTSLGSQTDRVRPSGRPPFYPPVLDREDREARAAQLSWTSLSTRNMSAIVPIKIGDDFMHRPDCGKRASSMLYHQCCWRSGVAFNPLSAPKDSAAGRLLATWLRSILNSHSMPPPRPPLRPPNSSTFFCWYSPWRYQLDAPRRAASIRSLVSTIIAGPIWRGLLRSPSALLSSVSPYSS